MKKFFLALIIASIFGSCIYITSADTAVDISANKTFTNSNTYTLLAPIGQQRTFDSKNIGVYFNYIFKIAIGLCAALAVVMIVISSIQYMGDESVFGKTEAKGKITSAIMGLIIAIGAYAILNTINPDLTGKGGLTVDQVSVEVDGEPMTANDPVPTGGAVTQRCPEGIDTNVVTSGGTFPACKTITSQLKNMINKAWTDGKKITGYGFRSKAKQIELRTQHCGSSQSDIYTKPAGQCHPPTAIPGTSMHESGLAFDMKCDGTSIRSQSSPCFIWLKQNAATYGFYNLSSEPWHWSTTGH